MQDRRKILIIKLNCQEIIKKLKMLMINILVRFHSFLSIKWSAAIGIIFNFVAFKIYQ